ncbi:MAG TPA: tetrahydrofolate dehydrogenase/cyclohydrolase catalytic domain-containing protein [Polyangiaceae bacterium]|nr:tetrahydrofolate dehydrogenase/cyclohydrolase catalytic domain-containing protein [Polyangiaceae bacterium]
MTAKLLSGAPVADAILAGVRARAAALVASGVQPTLAMVLVGDNPDSAGYVQRKHEACAAAGVASIDVRVPADAAPSALFEQLRRLNADPSVHGVIVQSPLPAGFDFHAALLAIDPRKDADGLHPESLGRLALGMPGPLAATPAGIVAMFQHYGIDVAGRHVAIVGRGPTIGRPLSLLLSAKRPGGNAIVTLLHGQAEGWERFTRQADVVIVGVGKPHLLTPAAVEPGAVVVSVGITWEGKKLVPDVAPEVAEVASWITPRLGGVGVMTVAMLLANTVALAEAASLGTGG